MIKKILSVFTVITFLMFSGCSYFNKKDEARGNYDVFECLARLNYDNNYEDATMIIGFEGELIDENNDSSFPHKTYEWQLTKDTSVTIRFDMDKDGNFTDSQIFANFPEETVANANLNLANAEAIEKRVSSYDGIYYDEFIEILGGEGVKTEISAISVHYIWVDDNGGILYGTFNYDGQCVAFSGVV